MMNSQDWQAAQAARNFAAQALIAAHPHLVAVSEKNRALVAAAKNIRIELAARFPGVTFSVRSKSYSMGNSIAVHYVDGPPTALVEAIVDRYNAGSFDGSTDSYTYRSDRAWVDAFGSAKYTSVSREFSDRVLGSVIARVCRYLGGLAAIPTAADYRAGKLWNLTTSGGCDVAREVSRALARHTCCI